MHTSFLWSSILVLAESGEGWRKLIQLMIKLSRSHPLDITVELFRMDGDFRFKDILNFQLDVIIPEVSRWKRISYLGWWYDDGFLFLKPLSKLSAPLLEVLEVSVETDEELFSDEHLCVFAGGAPLLSRFHVDGMKITSCLPPISSLTSLQLDIAPEPIDLALFKEILTASSTLTHIQIHGDVVNEDQLFEFAANGQTIDLPSLCSLWLEADIYPKHQFFGLISILRCPRLEVMKITAGLPVDRPPHSRPRHSYELPIYTSLRSLQLSYIDCTQLGVDLDVTKLPALTHITFNQCPTAISLLNNLIPTVEGKAVIWPLLQVISLDVGSLPDADVDRLCKVVSHRTQCGKPIECVRFDTMLVDLIACGNYVRPLRDCVRVETSW